MTSGRFLSHLLVTTRPGQNRAGGRLTAGGIAIPCALGRAGIIRAKREGDGGTPAGAFRLTGLLYRPDRLPRPRCGLPVIAIEPNSGWCDAPEDRAYNRPVTLPYPASAEHLWRNDHLYDVVVIIEYNMEPTRPGAGSAIFLHLATRDFSPTAGCVAIFSAAMRCLLPHLGPDTVIRIK